MKHHDIVHVLSLFSLIVNISQAFVSVHPRREESGHHLSSIFAASTSTDDITALDVVLFGIGDLRTDDHLGLIQATESSSFSRILPLVVLDEESISKVPGVVSHTFDTASMIAETVNDLKVTLARSKLDLQVSVGGPSLSEQLIKILENFPAEAVIRLHVCDAGDADNVMGYAPISNLDGLPENVIVKPWSCHLWVQPWSNVASVSKRYPDFEDQRKDPPMKPVSFNGSTVNGRGVSIAELTGIPTAEDIYKLLQTKLSLDDDRCEAERNSGMYATHWGGLESSTVVESKIQDTIQTYVEKCQEDDEVYAKIPVLCTRNPQSLEHASMCWNMRGGGESEDQPVPNNMIAGERMNRQLLAPLMLGTVSPRRLWHSMKKGSILFKSPVKTLVETREWHKLLAARNIQTDSQYQEESNESTKYKYWRWHGLLCRYAEADLAKGANPGSEGVVLVHGFGASGAQLTKTIDCLSEKLSGSTTVGKCVAPDIIGFGESEKPPVTYTGYMWESFLGDFIKDVATTRCQMDSFVIGGNSIGGFISMCAAANDASIDPTAISGGGSPGTGKCNGVILMNPAGVIQAKEDVVAMEQASNGIPLQSVAQVTATDGLPPCKPLPRPVARAFGTGLLAYLRPQIREICIKLYPTNPGAVDIFLCENILRDSLDPGAINVMISGSKLPTPRTYNEVIAADFGQASDTETLKESTFIGPILVAQGILDPLNDAKGRAEALKKLRSGITVDPLQAGHCPHDEVPDQVANSIATWLEATREERTAMLQNAKDQADKATTPEEDTAVVPKAKDEAVEATREEKIPLVQEAEYQAVKNVLERIAMPPKTEDQPVQITREEPIAMPQKSVDPTVKVTTQEVETPAVEKAEYQAAKSSIEYEI
ncbi:unnamed protein product [Cylindrotheca closterium]|uniref:AB hydrolase-1 domain-containing protein n=1 Tax=Cylindrotheca closterium TaxID=2856 RepID=A0AAD2G0B8_9STRA|nr:unnamed protein product [Cylindrotheca closterium]